MTKAFKLGLLIFLTMCAGGCIARPWIRDCEYLDGEFPTKVYSWIQFCDGDTSGTPCGECRQGSKEETEQAIERSKYQCHHGVGKYVKDSPDFYNKPGCDKDIYERRRLPK